MKWWGCYSFAPLCRRGCTCHILTFQCQVSSVPTAPPARLCNVTVHPSTVVATVRWHLTRDGGYPITHFTLAYQAVHWMAHNGSMPGPRQDVHISPAARQFFVYHLEPGTLYMFRLWASNRLGPGEATTVYASTASPRDPSGECDHRVCFNCSIKLYVGLST